jgi:prevent-host-death family protein
MNIISTSTLQRNIKDVFDKLSQEKNSLIVVRDSIPEAVLVPYDEFLRLADLEKDILKVQMRTILYKMKLKNAKYTLSDIDKDIKYASKATSRT